MIEDWERPAPPPTSGIAVRVAGVVPLARELGGSGEILALAAFGSVKLPSGEVRPGESILAAASRMLLGVAGVSATPERVVYIVEQAGKQLTVCVLCTLNVDEDAPEPRSGIRFVPLTSGDEFDPPAVRELLIEDIQGGFVRPIAWVSVGFDEFGRERATVSW